MNKFLSTLFVCLMLCATASADVRTWKGNSGADGMKWTVAANWVEGAVPTAADNVIIPAGCDVYPVLTAAASCHYIYFDVRLMSASELNSARIQGQHYLTYDKAFTDISITANRYIRVSSPLQSTYTGDFYVKHQTLDQSAWTPSTEGYPFVDALYVGSPGSTYEEGVTVNRALRGTYYSFYSSDYQILNPYSGYEVNSVVNQWGNPVNGLGTLVAPVTSFDVWVNNGARMSSSPQEVKDGTVTFHFPSANSVYYYFDDHGNWAPYRDPSYVDHAKAGRFAYGDNNEEKLTVTLTHPGNSQMYAVGNPAFAYMDIAEFINANQKSIAPYVYKYVQGAAGTRGKERIYYYNYDQTPHKLYCLTTSYDNAVSYADEQIDKLPKDISGKTSVELNNRERYVNPAEGFRVIGGSVAFMCDEPDLVGVYNNATFRIAYDVRSKYYNMNADSTSNGLKTGGLSNKEISVLKDRDVVFRYSISTTDKSDYVRINNFLNRGSVLAKIVPTVQGRTGKLVIEDDQQIMAVFKGMESLYTSNRGTITYPSTTTWTASDFADYWNYTHVAQPAQNALDITYDVKNTNQSCSTYTETSNYTTSTTATRSGYTEAYRLLKLHGLSAESAWQFSPSAYSVGYTVTGLTGGSVTPSVSAYNIVNSATTDIELDYSIDDDGVHISMPAGLKMFIESDVAQNNLSQPAFNAVVLSKPSVVLKDYQCEAWFAYESFSSTKLKDKTITGDFIFPNTVGTYTTVVRENLGNTANGIKCSSEYRNSNGYISKPNPAIKDISINRVLGSNNTVGITGLYPGSDVMVLGEIYNAGTASNPTYKMRIASGQLAHVALDADGNVDPAHSHYVYAHGNANDMVKLVEMTWISGSQASRYASGVVSTGTGYWQLKTKADNNDCYEIMVCRQGMQPLGEYPFFDGMIYGRINSDKTANYFELAQTVKGDVNKAPTSEIKPGQVGVLNLDYVAELFVANPALTTTTLSAPARVAAPAAGAPAVITAAADGAIANTMIVRSQNATNGYSRLEDAPLFDVAQSSLAFGTLAGTQLVGVNALSLLDTLPIYLSASATLTFTNVASLGDNVSLYDAVEGTTTLIAEDAEYALDIADGEQAGRYFLVADAPAAPTAVEEVEALTWKPVAYCPGSGTLAVGCAEELAYDVYGINGMLLASAHAQSYTFSGLQAGTYVVRATRGSETQAMKVIVY